MFGSDVNKIEYKLIRSSRKTVSLEINRDGEVIVRAPQRMTKAEINMFLDKHMDWLNKKLALRQIQQQDVEELGKFSEREMSEIRKAAKQVIPERVAIYAPLVGVTYGRISVKFQKTLWGSCSSNGNLNFNCLLVLLPPEVMDSVIVHELCHRKHMNHSQKFYEEVRRVYPEYDRYNKLLKREGKALMARLP